MIVYSASLFLHPGVALAEWVAKTENSGSFLALVVGRAEDVDPSTPMGEGMEGSILISFHPARGCTPHNILSMNLSDASMAETGPVRTSTYSISIDGGRPWKGPAQTQDADGGTETLLNGNDELIAQLQNGKSAVVASEVGAWPWRLSFGGTGAKVMSYARARCLPQR